jgi:spore germination protein KA
MQFSILKNMFIYKEPGNSNQVFELLEKSDEEADLQIPKPDIVEISRKYSSNKGSVEEQKKYKTTPTKIGEKKADDGMQQQQGEPSTQLEINLEYIKQRFNLPANQDVIIREFDIGGDTSAFLLFLEGMVDNNIVNQFIIPQINCKDNFEILKRDNFSEQSIKNVISINKIIKSVDLDVITKHVLNGMTALFIDGVKDCYLIESKGFEKRGVEAPQTESVIRGSQEAFTEDMRTNLTLLRRGIKNENLIVEITEISKVNGDLCAIVYLKGIANPKLINEVKRRVNSIDIDMILGSGMLMQLIEDNPFMLFPQAIETERPDRAVSFLIEGKVLMITEGTPFVLSVPITLFHLLHTAEDSLLRWQYGTFLRFIRYLGVLIALLLPGLYIALTLYHHEMIPTQLLLSIIKTREQVPFPVLLEILMLEFSFELIREGGIRVPGVIGNTLGIVGALILGQAAVAAGLVSPILIIIVAVTGIGSFVIPNYSLSLGVRIARFIMLLFGAIAGFYGVSLAIVGLFLAMASMKSFGVPFLSPLGPKTVTNPDIIIRFPLYLQKMRPDYMNTLNQSRQGKVTRGWKKGKGGRKDD